ncbi:MAG: biotin--[acetyl-CoA-carboxylase] ligase [Muribaculaceae bacterium]|nr:biotin--[acetyl-CoA-carboxylase] ligase [Muribaculaceae bacterium]
MRQLWIEETASTNAYVKEHRDSVEPMTMVLARRQTAGRGQRGNSWESAPGENLTFSLRFVPRGIRPTEQFTISEAAALAAVDTLAAYGVKAAVKWPNDIYVADGKVCGILIENVIAGTEIAESVIGIGLNVNQTVFESDAPNPVSMAGLTGRRYPLEEVTATFGRALRRRLAEGSLGSRALHEEYTARLWRGDGAFHPFVEAGGERVEAVIDGVELTGHLRLRLRNGETRRYAFKEVFPVLLHDI